ncbi:MAG: hypothetical protein LBW85_06220 [Deltaproteobacteria bacterium]|nr:hypothetical protein [Deltaproteobacteria bacterium]
MNLFLKVLGLRPDGLHELFCLTCPLSLADEVTIEDMGPLPGQDLLEVTDAVGSPSLPTDSALTGPESLVLRTVAAFRGETGGPARRIKARIVKRIPYCAGLGGVSSDAAAVLRILNPLAEAPLSRERLASLALRLGADMPFFLEGPPGRKVAGALAVSEGACGPGRSPGGPGAHDPLDASGPSGSLGLSGSNGSSGAIGPSGASGSSGAIGSSGCRNPPCLSGGLSQRSVRDPQGIPATPAPQSAQATQGAQDSPAAPDSPGAGDPAGQGGSLAGFRPMLVRGAGEALEPYVGPRICPAATLAGTGFPLSTGAVFREYELTKPRPGNTLIMQAASGPDLPPQGENDLLPAALRLSPELSGLLGDVSSLATGPYGLSGSGPVCWALFRDLPEAEAAAGELAGRGRWSRACLILGA